MVTLESVTCRDGGKFDIDCDGGSVVRLLGTKATANPFAGGQIAVGEVGIGTPASPR